MGYWGRYSPMFIIARTTVIKDLDKAFATGLITDSACKGAMYNPERQQTSPARMSGAHSRDVTIKLV